MLDIRHPPVPPGIEHFATLRGILPHTQPDGALSTIDCTRTEATAPQRLMSVVGLGATLQVKVIPPLWDAELRGRCAKVGTEDLQGKRSSCLVWFVFQKNRCVLNFSVADLLPSFQTQAARHICSGASSLQFFTRGAAPAPVVTGRVTCVRNGGLLFDFVPHDTTSSRSRARRRGTV